MLRRKLTTDFDATDEAVQMQDAIGVLEILAGKLPALDLATKALIAWDINMRQLKKGETGKE